LASRVAILTDHYQPATAICFVGFGLCIESIRPRKYLSSVGSVSDSCNISSVLYGASESIYSLCYEFNLITVILALLL